MNGDVGSGTGSGEAELLQPQWLSVMTAAATAAAAATVTTAAATTAAAAAAAATLTG